MVYVNTACPFFFYTPPYTYVARHVYNPSTIEQQQGDQEFKACLIKQQYSSIGGVLAWHNFSKGR